MIWPLTVVVQEASNTYSVRAWAVKQMRRIGSESGLRQPAGLADRFERDLLLLPKEIGIVKLAGENVLQYHKDRHLCSWMHSEDATPHCVEV